MDKIWKNSETCDIIISSDKPNDGGEYTDETNIANWIGMMDKKNITLEELHLYINSYVNNVNNSPLTKYDSKWYEHYINNILNN